MEPAAIQLDVGLGQSVSFFVSELNIRRLGVAIVDADLAKLPEDALDLLETVVPEFTLLAMMLLPRFRRVLWFAVEVGLAEVDYAGRFDNRDFDGQSRFIKSINLGTENP
jgi:hypothetical protein